MSSTVNGSGQDNQRGGLSGFVPAPLSTAVDTSPESIQTGSSNAGGDSTSNNFIYIYSFLSTLFVLLCIAILVLLRTLLRRRRLDVLFNQEGESSNDTAQTSQSQRQRRQKKRQHLGSKPQMSEAWIVSASQSTETLLQPFSVARAPENEKKPLASDVPVPPFCDAVEREPERKSPYPPPRVLSFWQLPSSSSSCTLDNEKAAGSSDNGHTSVGHSQTPISPAFSPTSQMPLEQLRIGFLIAMPRPRSALGNNSIRGTDQLYEGELPDLNVGISTIYAPFDSTIVPVRRTTHSGEATPPVEHAPERERRRRRRHIPIAPQMIDYP